MQAPRTSRQLALGILLVALGAAGCSGGRGASVLVLEGSDAAADAAPGGVADGPGGSGDAGSVGDGSDVPGASVDGPAPDGAGGGGDGPAPRAALGRPCERGEQCASGFCAQGVCCETGCSGTCFACRLPGTAGTCRPVPAGEDPLEQCSQDPLTTCGRDGTCDGLGGCRRYLVGTECAPGGCAGATETAASTCDGAGTCQPGSSKTCERGVCSGSSCGTSCVDASQCQAGFFCLAGQCQLKRPVGQACAGDGQCATGFCTDGVCCGSRCASICFACNLAGTLGSCTPTPSGQDPRAQCPAEPPASCGRAGGCDGSGACRLHPAGTVCAAATCSVGMEAPAGTCDGLSVCRPGAPRACAPYACSGATCATTCASPADCVPEYTCVGSACVPIPGLVLFWRFEETGGTQALDSSGAGHHGTLVGANGQPTPSPLVRPLSYANTNSLAFVQQSRHAVTIATLPPALRPANDLTLSLFYRSTKVDGNGSTAVGAELVSASNNYILRLRAGGDIEFSKHPASGSSVQCRAPAPGSLDGNWHHVAAVASATSGVDVYFDGARICTVANVQNISYDPSNGFWVGRHGDGEEQWDFDGNIDEVRVYARALTAAEVAVLAQGGK